MTDVEPRTSMRAGRVIAMGGGAVAAFLVACALDRTVYRAALAPDLARADWHEFLKSLGTLYPWLALAAVMTAVDWARGSGGDRWLSVRRGALTLLGAVIAGGVAEGLKLVIRRERPILHDGAHVFRSWSEGTLSTSNLDLPSSHVAVVFGAAFVLARMWPRARWALLAIALASAGTRLTTGSHFLSAALLGAVVGWASSALLWRLDAPGRERWLRAGAGAEA